MIYLFKIWFPKIAHEQSWRARADMATMMIASAYFWLEDNGYILLSLMRKEVEDLFLGFGDKERNIDRVLVTSEDHKPSLRIRANSLENEILVLLTMDADRDDVYSLTRKVIGGEYTSPKLIIENRVRARA